MDQTHSSYKDLIVWQKAFELTKEVYQLTKLFPQEEIYGLTLQVKRATISIVSNIAEGFTRKTIKEKLHFMHIAFGSSSEVETQLLLAKELKFTSQEKFKKSEELIMEVRKILNHFILKTKNP